MHVQTSRHPGLSAQVVAHQGPEGRLLLVSLSADETTGAPAPSARVAVVLDRSGSMKGRKLHIAKQALAQLIRSLRPDDRIGVVVYDHKVDLLSPLAPPSEALARSVEDIDDGGNTNLYGGWLCGAKLVSPGGRVLLLSDGLANVGRYDRADDLSHHAGISYERYRVSTSTIGVSDDYDEALMAGMARAGGGAHYFAHEADDIMRAFSEERFSIGAIALSHVSLRFEGTTHQVGHLWEGETKKRVLRIGGLSGAPLTVRYTQAESGEAYTVALEMPREFGHSDEATLELILAEGSAAQIQAGGVRGTQSAREARDRVRAVLLKLLAHPLADTELALAARSLLEASIARLEQLERRYDERDAARHRKRSFQASHNFQERAHAFRAFDEDAYSVKGLVQASLARDEIELTVDMDAYQLVPAARWLAWQAAPVQLDGNQLKVALPNPKDGFVISEIERETGRKVRPVPSPIEEEHIARALWNAAKLAQGELRAGD